MKSWSGEECARMTDKYENFAELRRTEKERDFRICLRDHRVPTSVIAPHGGDIEPGTSEIADAIAGDDFSFYAFEGMKHGRNRDLHITSHRFDEPKCVNLVKASTRAIAIHGRKGEAAVVYLGGRDTRALKVLRATLLASGFHVKTDRRLEGRCGGNICNRTRSGAGVQLEITRGLRRSFFQGLRRNCRRHKTERFDEFVTAVRKGFSERLGKSRDSDVPPRSSNRPSKARVGRRNGRLE
jgi:phage replication-related protein YjqB (UPF0714/DUF867 family)